MDAEHLGGGFGADVHALCGGEEQDGVALLVGCGVLVVGDDGAAAGEAEQDDERIEGGKVFAVEVVGGDEAWSKYGYILSEYVKDAKIDCKPRNVPKRYKDLPPDEQRRLMSLDDEKRISKYIAKLSNHALKETNRRSVLIYSKPKVKQLIATDLDGYVYSDKKGKVIALVPTDENLPF